jgi:hypothetical protein
MNRSTCRTLLLALAATLALSALTAGSAFASGAPIVTTQPATGVTASEAVLHGKVNPNGLSTKYSFEYGTTVAYGSKTLESAGILTEVNGFKNAPGLESKSLYHFRVVATNSSGTSFGADETFSTLAQKPEFAVKAGEKLSELVLLRGGSKGTWVTKNGQSFTCSGGEGGGVTWTVTGPKTVKGKFLFTGCGGETTDCRSFGAKAHEVITEELTGTLVYLSKAAKTVGIVFKPSSTAYLAKFDCHAPDTKELRGAIIVPVGPVNILQFGVQEGALNVNGLNVQEITEYENASGGKVHAGLESMWLSEGTWTPLAWGAEAISLTTNKQAEIEA